MIIQKKLPNIFIIMPFFILLSSNVRAARELIIPPKYVDKSEWCWNACCEMTLEYYGVIKAQFQIANWIWGSEKNVGLFLYSSTPGDKEAVNKVLENFASSQIGETYYSGKPNGTLTIPQIYTEINKNSPIIILGQTVFTSPYKYHGIMITGYIDNSPTNPTIICIEPTYGAREEKPFLNLKKTSVWEWQESLRLQKSGIGGAGLFDGVTIATTDFTYTEPAVSRTYTGNFVRATGSTAYATEWTWTLSFNHSGGEYVVGSYLVPNVFNLSTTWNAPSFLLPTSYVWYYTNDGAVLGHLKLSCMDSDGFYHDDTKDVFYTPQNPYPMTIVLANSSASGTLPDVKAHQLIVLRNYQVNSGASISYKSGEAITLKDETSIQNGSSVRFIIDPALR
jgi:hypothetical protein